jgi:hypothetical protein
MKLFWAAGVMAVAALLAAPHAAADPEDYEPYCTSGQVPELGACKSLPGTVYVDDAPGANPQIPIGLNPESVPAV